jgi:hypothetical protein
MGIEKIQNMLRKAGEKNQTLGFAIDKADKYVQSHSEEELREEMRQRGLNPDTEDKREKIKIKRILRKFARKK